MRRSGGFYKWAWDPIEGCKNGCSYCYARKEIEIRGDNFDMPVFFEERLIEPSKVRPNRIFVNHYTDIMGEFIPKKWIDKIINVCRVLPKHTFIFMTKNPLRYYDFKFPDNCILGVTIESPEEWERAGEMMYISNRKMCSVEPILGDFTGYDFSQFELVVVGGLENEKKDYELYKTVKHPNIHYKW